MSPTPPKIDPPKPLLLLDIDGALSPFNLPEEPSVDWQAPRIWGFEMPLHPMLRDWLRTLGAEYDFVWATTWERDGIEEMAKQLGLEPQLPRILFGADAARAGIEVTEPDFDEGLYTEKLGYVEHWLRETGNEDRQLAWIEDRLEADAFEWARKRSAPTLLIHTDRDYGLTAEDVTRLEMFAASPELVSEPAR